MAAGASAKLRSRRWRGHTAQASDPVRARGNWRNAAMFSLFSYALERRADGKASLA
jgi:hypothetical protein